MAETHKANISHISAQCQKLTNLTYEMNFRDDNTILHAVLSCGAQVPGLDLQNCIYFCLTQNILFFSFGWNLPMISWWQFLHNPPHFWLQLGKILDLPNSTASHRSWISVAKLRWLSTRHKITYTNPMELFMAVKLLVFVLLVRNTYATAKSQPAQEWTLI